jgi:hypothetical protein
LLSILVVLWMTFVIVHDRVLHDCCWFLSGGTLAIVNHKRLPDLKLLDFIFWSKASDE